MTVLSFKDLDVWQKAMKMVSLVYGITKQFPKEEVYGLTSQIRRSAVSIPSNIAEGRGKRSTKDFIRFLNIAYGSSAELEPQLLIAIDLGYINLMGAEPLFDEISQINRMLNGMIGGLEKKLVPLAS